MNRSGGIGARLWRSLLSVAVAYAVTIQSLMIAVAGFSLPVGVGQSGPAFELCLHDASGAPVLLIPSATICARNRLRRSGMVRAATT